MDQQVEQLCTFAWNGEVEKARPLLEEMSAEKINTPNSRGQSALYCAARNGKEDMIELLGTKKGLNINVQVASHGGTPLHASGFSGHAECTALLLMLGADATVVNVSGMSAREEAKGDSIDVYFVYDYNGIPGLIEKYPQYAKYAKVDKKKKNKPSKSNSANRDKEAERADRELKKESRNQLRAVTSSGNVRIDAGFNPKDSDGSRDKSSKSANRKSVGENEASRSHSTKGKRKSVDFSKEKRLILGEEFAIYEAADSYSSGSTSSTSSRRTIPTGAKGKRVPSKDYTSSMTSSAGDIFERPSPAIWVFPVPNATATTPKPLATIEELLEFENMKLKDRGQEPVALPSIIAQSIQSLWTRGLASEGLFRVPGCKTRMDLLEEKCNSGNSIDLDMLHEEAADVASFLKKYLREVPDRPLFTRDLEGEFAAISDQNGEEGEGDSLEMQVQKFLVCYHKLPKLNQLIVQQLLFLLSQVVRNEYTNRMTLDAVSIVFGQMSGILCTLSSSKIVNWSIENYHHIFEDEQKARNGIVPIYAFTQFTHPVRAVVSAGEYMLFVMQNGHVKIINGEERTMVREADLFTLQSDQTIQSVIVCGGALHILVTSNSSYQVSFLKIFSINSLCHTESNLPLSEVNDCLFNNLLLFNNKVFVSLGAHSLSEINGAEPEDTYDPADFPDMETLEATNMFANSEIPSEGHFVLTTAQFAYKYVENGGHFLEKWDRATKHVVDKIDIEHPLRNVTVLGNQLFTVIFNDFEYLCHMFTLDGESYKNEEQFEIRSTAMMWVDTTPLYTLIGTTQGLVVVEKRSQLMVTIPQFNKHSFLKVSAVDDGESVWYYCWMQTQFNCVECILISGQYLEDAFQKILVQKLSKSDSSLFESSHAMVFALSRYNRPLCNQIMPPVMKSLVSRNRNASANAVPNGCSICRNALLWPVKLDCGCQARFCFACIFHYDASNCPECKQPVLSTRSLGGI